MDMQQEYQRTIDSVVDYIGGDGFKYILADLIAKNQLSYITKKSGLYPLNDHNTVAISSSIIAMYGGMRPSLIDMTEIQYQRYCKEMGLYTDTILKTGLDHFRIVFSITVESFLRRRILQLNKEPQYPSDLGKIGNWTGTQSTPFSGVRPVPYWTIVDPIYTGLGLKTCMLDNTTGPTNPFNSKPFLPSLDETSDAVHYYLDITKCNIFVPFLQDLI